jgi:hypothetical protein
MVERDFAWLHRNRRLLVRYERDAALHDAFLHHRLRTHLLEVARANPVITVRRSYRAPSTGRPAGGGRNGRSGCGFATLATGEASGHPVQLRESAGAA